MVEEKEEEEQWRSGREELEAGLGLSQIRT